MNDLTPPPPLPVQPIGYVEGSSIELPLRRFLRAIANLCLVFGATEAVYWSVSAFSFATYGQGVPNLRPMAFPYALKAIASVLLFVGGWGVRFGTVANRAWVLLSAYAIGRMVAALLGTMLWHYYIYTPPAGRPALITGITSALQLEEYAFPLLLLLLLRLAPIRELFRR